MSSINKTRFFNSVDILNSPQSSEISNLSIDGSLTASGITYPTTLGTTGQIIVVDSSGNLEFQDNGVVDDIITNSITGETGNLTLSGKTSADEVIFGTNLKLGSGVDTIYDNSGNELLELTSVASAVNNLEIANSATGNNPTITAVGGDTNIDIELATKGTGSVRTDSITGKTNDLTLSGNTPASDFVVLGSSLKTGATTRNVVDNNENELLVLQTTASAVNHLQIANSATGNNPTITAVGGDTNVGINLTPIGTGAVVCSSRLAFNNRSVSVFNNSTQSIGGPATVLVAFDTVESGFNNDGIYNTTTSRFTNSSGRTVFWMVSYSIRFTSGTVDTRRATWIRFNGSDDNPRYGSVSLYNATANEADLSGSALIKMNDTQFIEIIANTTSTVSSTIGSTFACCRNRCQVYEFSAT